MTKSGNPPDMESSIQEHCIDLPGEMVQCWIGGGTKKLKVILRKHRDVIFDIHLGTGKNYTIEATESDFYSPRDKKLIYAAQHGKITFKDGERMHVWVSRNFRGALVLRCDGITISEVKPNEWDTHHHSNDPKEKPAPIIVTIGNSPAASNSPKNSKALHPIANYNHENSINVYEASKKAAPLAIVQFFENGGESLNIDSSDIVTQNWIIGQIVGTGAYIADNKAWARELIKCKFYLKKIHHRSGPKVYLIFTGNNQLREVMSASRYSLQNSKIIQITGGAGGVKQGWDAAKGAAKDSIKIVAREEGRIAVKGGGIAIILTITMDVAEWYKDYSEIGADGKPKKDLLDLFTKLGIDLAKTSLVAALSTITVAVAFSLAAAAGATVALPVIAIVIGTIAIGFIWSYAIEFIDKNIAHAVGEEDIATWLTKRLRETAQHLTRVSKDVRYEDYAAAMSL